MKKTNNPFECHDTDNYIACVGNNGFPDNFTIKEGYKNSVNILIDAVKHGGTEDELIYPIVYNARHCLELSLKIIIENIIYIYQIKNKRFDEVDKKLHTHDIDTLNSIIIKYYHVDQRIVKYYDKTSPYLNDYFFDKDGDAFKYQTNVEGSNHMITRGISSISIDVLEEKFNKVMSIFDPLIFEMDYLCKEYKIGTFTKNLSREDIMNIAYALPNRSEWGSSYFDEAKDKIKTAYELGSKEFSEALNIIQNHREFCTLINIEKVFGNLSEDELRKYAHLVIKMEEYKKGNNSQMELSEKSSKDLLLEIQYSGQKRKKLSEGISDTTLLYLMTFREYGRSASYFSENAEDILAYFQKNNFDRMDTLKKVDKVYSCKEILFGMKKCGQVTYQKIIEQELCNLKKLHLLNSNIKYELGCNK